MSIAKKVSIDLGEFIKKSMTSTWGIKWAKLKKECKGFFFIDFFFAKNICEKWFSGYFFLQIMIYNR